VIDDVQYEQDEGGFGTEKGCRLLDGDLYRGCEPVCAKTLAGGR
jgi:hypothetical protein